MRIPQAPATLDVRPLSSLAWPGQGSVWPASGWLLGWALWSADGATDTTARLFDGGDVGGEPLAVLHVPGAGDVQHGPALPGIPLESGLFLSVITGQLAGTFLVGVPA